MATVILTKGSKYLVYANIMCKSKINVNIKDVKEDIVFNAFTFMFS